MDTLLLARLQFAITTVYHFFFVPLTLGLSVLVAIMETAYVNTGQDVYKRMTKFWGKLFLINFATGVVTGIVLEFQFGMNWSEYSRFMGDIFGVPLAIEALLAFFLESTMLGIWIFGWDRLPKRVHLASIWLVAIGSNLSALWILIANSFMQEPVGYAIESGRARLTSFVDLLLNPHVLVQFPHVLTAGLTTASFFVLGISAWHLLRRPKDDEAGREVMKRSFQIGAIIAVMATLAVIVVGHNQAQLMVKIQPMKMAAAEALWENNGPASMSLITIGNEPQKRDVFSIRIPRLLSLLACNNLTCDVEGIKEIQARYIYEYGPGNYVPPVALSYWTFRTMVGVGFLMLALAVMAIFYVIAENFELRPRYLKLLTLAVFLPYIANTSGWLLTELGRQPWIVFGLMTVDKAVSPNVPFGSMLFSLIGFTLIIGGLVATDAYLLHKYAHPDAAFGADDTHGESDSLLMQAPAK
jgi:cytochrome d ubiquinol oxidase subunit I